MKYGFIGCGNMGGAVARALSLSTKDIMLSDRSGRGAALAQELGPSGVRCNCIAPGVIETDMCKDVAPETMAQLAEDGLVGRNGAGEDIAQAMLYLADASFVTGQVLPVNGGILL